MRKIFAIIILSIILTGMIVLCIINRPDIILEKAPIATSETLKNTEQIQNITERPGPDYESIFKDWENKEFVYAQELDKEGLLMAQQNIEEYLLSFYSIIRELPEEYREEAIAYAEFDMTAIESVYSQYCQDYMVILEQEAQEAKRWQERMEEYPTATAVWKYLIEAMGCNEYVAAGIIGNMMAECGGQTLSLNWSARNATGHYGLCQWSTGFTKVQGADLQGQLDFMAESFPQQIDRWGDICYKDDFTYEDFMALEDAEEAAYAFCVIYERPGPGSYNQRKENAKIALEYFTS
jgi:hypothetical protein